MSVAHPLPDPPAPPDSWRRAAWRRGHELIADASARPPAPFFRRVNYSSVNEDWRTEAHGLRLRDGDRVLCVTGSGDRPLDLLAAADVDVVAVDAAAPQNHLLHLKMAALRALPFADYAAFLGLTEASPEQRLRSFARLAAGLPPDAAAFWVRRPEALAAGVLTCGRFEQHFQRVARLVRRLRPRALEQLLGFERLEDQRRFLADVWDRRWWRALFRLVCHPWVARLVFRDPAYYAHTQVPVGATLYARMLALLQHRLARESFMISLVLRGRLTPDDLPPYLTEAGAAVIRERLDRVRVVTADLDTYLHATPAEAFDAFSLSDVPSFLSERAFHGVMAGALMVARQGARVVVRQFLTRYPLEACHAPTLRREPQLEARLAREDRAFAYEFIVGTVDHGLPLSGDGVRLRPYRRDDDPAAVALERGVSQGGALRLSFRRSTFRRRAESFEDHRLVVAEADGQLVGTVAVAFKDGAILGTPGRLAFLFDLRVAPGWQGRGVARRLGVAALRAAHAEADLTYCYAVADNRIMRYLLDAVRFQDVAGYAYLVVPTYRALAPSRPVSATSLDVVHERYVWMAGPFDVYTDPRRGGRLDGHVGSWEVRDGADYAGCSAWDNRAVLAEVVEALPWPLRLLRLVLRGAERLGRRVPHLPADGERLRSWYLFDVAASRDDLARDLLRHVTREARRRGIDYCYVVHRPADRWVEALRAELPRLVAPVVPYRVAASWPLGPVPELPRLYVDVRDL